MFMFFGYVVLSFSVFLHADFIRTGHLLMRHWVVLGEEFARDPLYSNHYFGDLTRKLLVIWWVLKPATKGYGTMITLWHW